ncbi:MAG: MBL fold metallo-hydrolase [Asgard group archaeon]|nr:MBL fold metallo-hydrolase [Asgard group archaeon]
MILLFKLNIYHYLVYNLGITIYFIDHASFKIKIDNKFIYIDPYGGTAGDYKDKAEIILSSHRHSDHSNKQKIAFAKKESTVVLTSTDNVPNLGGNAQALDPGQKFELGNITIYGVPAYNHKRFREPGIPFHPKGIETAFIIEANGKRIYFAGDTDFIEEMKDLQKIDVAILPIDGHYTMSPDEAVEAIGAFKPKAVIPMHYGNQKPDDFKKKAEKKYPDIKVKVIKPGKELDL